MRPLAVALAWWMTAPVGPLPRAELVARDAYVMGTRATLSTFDADRREGLARLERMLRAIETAEATLSTWRESSEVSRLNGHAGDGPRQVSPSLCASLRAIDSWVTATDGAFDPAIGALVAAWDLHGRGRVPSDADLASARQRSGWARIAFDGARCTIALARGVTLDVGAWGKGDGLDRAREAGGDRPWLIDLGGQVAAHGAPPGAASWTVAIAHPWHRENPELELRLRGGSLATSAGSERDLEIEGRRIGHILDPRTGRPASFTGSVTVWHERALVADVLSTALFVMGPERGAEWAEARGLAACYLIPGAGGVVQKATPTFRRRFAAPTSSSRLSRPSDHRRSASRNRNTGC